MRDLDTTRTTPRDPAFTRETSAPAASGERRCLDCTAAAHPGWVRCVRCDEGFELSRWMRPRRTPESERLIRVEAAARRRAEPTPQIAGPDRRARVLVIGLLAAVAVSVWAVAIGGGW